MIDINEENNKKRFIVDEKECKFEIKGSKENVGEIIQQRNREELARAMDKYMPIGSVVKIQDSYKNYMIIGFNYNLNNRSYDYLACEYPFGIDSNHQSKVFDHNQIEKVFHIGFVNNQEKKFKSDLLENNVLDK